MIQDFGPTTPEKTGLPLKWQEMGVLSDFAHANPPPNTAFVSVDAVPLCDSLMGAQYLHKERMPAPSLGVTYVGAIAIPFTEFFTKVVFIAMEHGTTGMREAAVMLLDNSPFLQSEPKKLEPGEDLLEVMRNAPLRRIPSDDEVWDEKFPEHPLSRVRARLLAFRRSLQVDDAVRAATHYRG